MELGFKNIVGVVSSSAKITVLERPVISVQPPNSVQVQRGERVQLDCIVTGQPKPLFYWSKEIWIKFKCANFQ